MGVDGAPGGWVWARSGVSAHSPVEFGFADTWTAILALAADRIVVDMPIGLSADGRRPVDDLARERLGHRRATFFPTPVRGVLDCESHDDANATNRSASGRGLSVQAWNLVPKIRSIDSCWTDAHTERVFEGHPETSFAAIGDGPITASKHTSDGRQARIRLLERALSNTIVDVLEASALRRSIWGDAIDAAAVLWTAQRLGRGEADVLGGELDDRARPMRLAV